MRPSAREMFIETGPSLDSAQRRHAIRQAHRAAVEAQESLTLTAKRQYRRYRRTAGSEFMAWPEWHAHYLEKYRAFNALRTDGNIGGA